MGHGQRRLGRGQGRAVYRKTWLMNQHYHVLVSTITKCEPLTNHSAQASAAPAACGCAGPPWPRVFETEPRIQMGSGALFAVRDVFNLPSYRVLVKQLHGSQGTELYKPLS